MSKWADHSWIGLPRDMEFTVPFQFVDFCWLIQLYPRNTPMKKVSPENSKLQGPVIQS